MDEKRKALAALANLKDQVEDWENAIEYGRITDPEVLDEVAHFANHGREMLEKIC